MGVSQILLFVKAQEPMLAFYGDALGFPVVEAREGWTVLDAGGCRLALHTIPPHIAAHIEITTPPRRRGDTPIKLFFRVDAARAAAAGGPGEVLDPEGNVLVIDLAR